ncbi:MAG TPA: hypothetical protein VE890_06520 [Thermoguttaceae bacterium]|nr:hypothetical protein [Thermoguttaceae bacterium]
MKTVRITLALAMALAMTAPMMAQEKAAKGKGSQLSPISRVLLRMGKIHDALQGLDLSAEQKEKLGKAREEHGPKMKAFFDKLGEIFTEEQRNAAREAGAKATTAGKEGRDLFLAIEAAVKSTDEQKEKSGELAKELSALSREMTKSTMHILTPEQREKMKKALFPQGRKLVAKKPAEKE